MLSPDAYRVDISFYSERCRDTKSVRYSSKAATQILCTWPLRWAWPHWNFTAIFVVRKLESWTILSLCFRVMIHFAVLVELRLVTDWQTDEQTDEYLAIAYTTLAYTSRDETAKVFRFSILLQKRRENTFSIQSRKTSKIAHFRNYSTVPTKFCTTIRTTKYALCGSPRQA